MWELRGELDERDRGLLVSRCRAIACLAAVVCVAAATPRYPLQGVRSGANELFGEPVLFVVVDSEPDGDYDDDDVEAALAACVDENPLGGCIIELEAQTYTDVQIEIPAQVTEFRGQGDASVLLGPASPAPGPIILREPRDQGFATKFHDFKVDGNKQNLTSAPTEHNCIRIEDATNATLTDGEVYNVTCESVAHEGFLLDDAPRWSITSNTFRYLGCYDPTGTAEDPWSPGGIDSDLMGCGSWAAGEPDESNQPGRVTNGVGIEIGRNSDDVVITGNVIEYVTKIGIQGIDSSGAAESSYPEGGLVSENTVRWAGSVGIAMVRTTGWTVSSNTIEDTTADWQFGNTGQGIACSFAGRGNLFDGNTTTRTGGPGLDVGCGCGLAIGAAEPHTCNIIVRNNTVTDPCQVFTTNTAAINIQAQSWQTLDPFVDGVEVYDNEVAQSVCPAALWITGYSGMDLTNQGGFYGAGASYGLYVTDGEDLDVYSRQFFGFGSGTGIFVENTVSDCVLTFFPTGAWSTEVDNQCV